MKLKAHIVRRSQWKWSPLVLFALAVLTCFETVVNAQNCQTKDDLDEATRRKVEAVVEASGDRIKLFSDILLYGTPFFRKDPAFDQVLTAGSECQGALKEGRGQ